MQLGRSIDVAKPGADHLFERVQAALKQSSSGADLVLKFVQLQIRGQ